ncbi:MAG TPA: alpha/beta fold hydrolase [Steroidobacteraceae bacterium]|nr:alpha/beta fold hydrolase [Steroidobacteraceae bacterium]
MAARFWRGMLACELAIAAAVAWICAKLLALSTPGAIGVALLTLVAILFLFVMASYALAFASRAASGSPRIGYTLRALLTEPAAFGLAQVSMAIEPWMRVRDTPVPSGGALVRPVLLIHGVLCDRGVWRRIQGRLRAARFAPVRAVDLEPLRSDLDSCVSRIEEELLRLHRESRGARVAIVAHSMGGLVARAALQSLGPGIISRIVTVASPHHGTALAHCLPCKAGQQMRPASAWLQRLNAAQEGRFAVPVTSIYSLEDNLLAPARSAELRGAELREIAGVGHFGLLRSRRVLDALVAALAPA